MKPTIINKQTLAFAIVGVSAACVHFFAVLILVHWLHWLPLVANLLAFLIAFQVSYQGHSGWTFACQSFTKANAWWRFFLVAAASFMLNEALFALLLHMFELPYIEALVIVLIIVPPVTYVVSKLWAFKQRSMPDANH